MVTTIDASKAFDKICRDKLWLKLSRMIGLTLTKILIKYYSLSESYVLKDGIMSPRFKTTVGLKQGGPISPLLFSLYINDLVELIDLSEIGIKINSMTINTLLYADDIVLIANDRHSMQKMLNIVDQFGKKNYILNSSFL